MRAPSPTRVLGRCRIALMKLHILSDLHLSVEPFERPVNDADVVVLAGDIARPREAVAWAQQFSKPVLYVPGNHEFYGSSIDATTDELKRLSAGTDIHILDGAEVVIGSVRFLGTTLWTDFRLFGEGTERLTAMAEAQRFIRDFSRIRAADGSEAPFTPDDSACRFERQADWLGSRLGARHEGPTVVITHHAPSTRSIHPRFEGSRLNACFVSDADGLLDGDRVALWIHGHVHDSFDYLLNGTRVVCNPRGYAKAGVNENPHFDPHLTIALG